MKIKRYLEDDMRQAMRKVRTELGPDAVLLSSKRIDGKTEIVVAIDYDEKLLPGTSKRALEGLVSAAKPEVIINESNETAALGQMKEELAHLRGLFEGELSKLAWREMGSREPNRLALQSRLEHLGINRQLCARVLDPIGPFPHLEQGWRDTQEQLAKLVRRCEDDILNNGGVVALVGSTGVGKTTTIAKLAARFCLRHGRKNIALITTDSFRVGGQEQLITFGSMLGIPVQVATSAQEMKRTLDSLSDRKLILIDTAGMSQRDHRLTEQFATLAAASTRIRPYLVLSAISQAPVIQETIQAYRGLGLAGAVVTKTDETVSFGPVLSGLIRNQLPLAFIGNGQRVPEDLLPARPEYLVDKAVEQMQQNRTLEELDSQPAVQGGYLNV